MADDPAEIQFKIKRIAALFSDLHNDDAKQFNGNTEKFDTFGDTLIAMNLAQKNCGGRPECEGCPNSLKTSKILDAFKKDKRSFLTRIKSFFRRAKKRD